MSTNVEIALKWHVSLLALVVVAWRHLRPGRLDPERPGLRLVALAALSLFTYTNFGTLDGKDGIHHWEQFHYFLGSKYFPEVRYDGLYVASAQAELEAFPDRPGPAWIRDLRDNEMAPLERLRPHMEEVRARFSPARWRDFVADNRYFLEAAGAARVTQFRGDHGYNPTPTWTFFARQLTTRMVASSRSLTLLALLDPLLLLGMFGVIWRTFGGRRACLVMILFGTGCPWRFYWVGGAMLRFDWLVAVGLAICLLERRRPGAAGLLLAYAAMVRVFPVVYLAAAGLAAVPSLLRREVPAWLRRLALGFGLGVVALGGAGCLAGGGWEAWPRTVRNLAKHGDNYSTNNVGLRFVFLYDWDVVTQADVDFQLPEPWEPVKRKITRRARERRPWIWLGAAALALATAAACRGASPAQAAVLGSALAFAALDLTCYYWAALCLLPLARARWAPAAGWLGLNTYLFTVHLFSTGWEPIYGAMSWGLAVFFVAWFAPSVRDAWRDLRRA